MKAKFYTLIVLVAMLTSCRSIEKMVDKGQYDEALIYSVRKLAGEKKKKTEYVVGLETAYAQLTARDQNEVDILISRGTARDWENVQFIYDRMDRRQAVVAPLIPLVSVDGYIANFDLKNFGMLKRDANLNAAEIYYQEVLSLIKDAENRGSKIPARNAYNLIEKIERLEPAYKDIRALSHKARDLGVLTIGVEVRENHMGQLLSIVSDRLSDLSPSRLNTMWNRFEYIDFENKEYNKYLVIELESIDFGSERETNNNYEINNTIQDGYIYIKDRNGKPMKDTLGNEIKEPKYINVSAWVTETFREKHSSVAAKIKLYDSKASYADHTIPVVVVHDFKDSAVRFRGDRRALDHQIVNRLGHSLSGFPTDMETAYFLGQNLVAAVEKTAKNMHIRE